MESVTPQTFDRSGASQPSARRESYRPAFLHLVTGHFREGSGYSAWRERGTDDWLLIGTLAGGGQFGHVKGPTRAHPGDLILLPPGTPHDYGTDPAIARWELIWTHFHPRPHWHEWLDWPEAAPGLLRLTLPEGEIQARITARMFDMHQLANGATRRREARAMNALEEVLLLCDASNPRSEQARIDPRVQAAMDHLCHHLAEPFAAATLARVATLSPSRLAALFRQQTGSTPVQFLERQRMDRARQLLTLTSRPIQAIAREVGFDNPFYFTLRFKRHTGAAPRDFRRQELDRGTSFPPGRISARRGQA